MAKEDGGRKSVGEEPKSELFGQDQGVFMISVAAELAGMHPQTLRIYEARGLITPTRSPKRTRLYSRQDVERLRRIQELTTEFGLNLAGVERVLALEKTMESMRAQLEALKRETVDLEQEMIDRIQAVHRSYRRELVPWEPPGEMLRMKDVKPFKIRITRPTAESAGKPADDQSEPEARAGGTDAAR